MFEFPKLAVPKVGLVLVPKVAFVSEPLPNAGLPKVAAPPKLAGGNIDGVCEPKDGACEPAPKVCVCVF